MKKIILKIITFYQRTLSPDHSWFAYKHPYGFCRYYPSCSEYAKQAVEKHGVLKGAGMASRRVLRCNPLRRGGWDPIKS